MLPQDTRQAMEGLDHPLILVSVHALSFSPVLRSCCRDGHKCVMVRLIKGQPPTWPFSLLQCSPQSSPQTTFTTIHTLMTLQPSFAFWDKSWDAFIELSTLMKNNLKGFREEGQIYEMLNVTYTPTPPHSSVIFLCMVFLYSDISRSYDNSFDPLFLWLSLQSMRTFKGIQNSCERR